MHLTQALNEAVASAVTAVTGKGADTKLTYQKTKKGEKKGDAPVKDGDPVTVQVSKADITVAKAGKSPVQSKSHVPGTTGNWSSARPQTICSPHSATTFRRDSVCTSMKTRST